MILIEPCCTSKTVPAILSRLGNSGTELWHGCADLTLADLLTPILAHYNGGVELLLVVPRIPQYLADALRTHLAQGSIAHLTLLTDARSSTGAPAANLAQSYPARITLASHPVADTLLLLPDTAWWGNLGRGEHIGTVTRNNLVVESLRKVWGEVAERYRIT